MKKNLLCFLFGIAFGCVIGVAVSHFEHQNVIVGAGSGDGYCITVDVDRETVERLLGVINEQDRKIDFLTKRLADCHVGYLGEITVKELCK